MSTIYLPCGTCNKVYIGETGRGLDQILKEHTRDVKNGMDHSSFVVHARQTNHLPDWYRASILVKCKSKGLRKMTEAAYITTNDTINTRMRFIKWAKSAALFSMNDIRASVT